MVTIKVSFTFIYYHILFINFRTYLLIYLSIICYFLKIHQNVFVDIQSTKPECV